jgi:hypothetical protein
MQNVNYFKFHRNMRELAVAEMTHDVSLEYGSSLVAYGCCCPSIIDIVAALRFTYPSVIGYYFCSYPSLCYLYQYR